MNAKYARASMFVCVPIGAFSMCVCVPEGPVWPLLAAS